MPFYSSIRLLPATLTILGLLSIAGCKFEADNWVADIPSIGAMSSPAATDLNGDGVLDIVMGGATREFKSTEAGVFALDGVTGNLLWQYPARNQMVGSPIFLDITGDGSDDVFIGGRSDQYVALDGNSGTLLWEYAATDPGIDYVNDTTVLNFFNGQWVPDQDGDGVQDIICAYGGFVKAPAGDPNRPAGYLILLSGATGERLQKVRVPDGRETYMSPVVADFGRGLEVIFGTGGEDLPGRLYLASLSDVVAGDLSKATILVDGGDKGFIAPPVLANAIGTDALDVIVSSVDGRLICIDGETLQVAWTASPGPDFDTYTMPAPGRFSEGGGVDFFASFGKGAWPSSLYNVHLLIDGQTGQELWRDTLGTFQYASPVVQNLYKKSPGDDVLLSINTKSQREVLGKPTDWYNNTLYVYSEGRGEPIPVFPQTTGSNLGSTPLLTDIDGDEYLDIITTYMSDATNFYSFKNLRVERREVNLRTPTGGWGGYMGPAATAIYQPR